MEGADGDLAVIEHVLCRDQPVPLVDLTRPGEQDVGPLV